MQRVSKLLTQLDNKSTESSIRPQNVAYVSSSTRSDDDIVIVSSIRTAIGRARKGSFKDTDACTLLEPCLRYVVKDVDPKYVNDVCVGTVLAPGSLRASECRMAAFMAGYPRTATVRTVNRQCSSGLQAIADIAAAIQAGYIECGVAAGVETMTQNPMKFDGFDVTDDMKLNNDALNCLLPMGITSENVAAKFGVTRKEQDALAAQSHARAYQAQLNKFSSEIVPVKTRIKNKDTGKVETIVVTKDDGIRGGTTVEGLGKLRPAFKKGGTTTAGNSSQVSDGASAALIMKRSLANRLGVKPMATFRAFAVSGVDPAVMGIGPAFAIPDVVQQAGLTLDDIDLYEINEAFASQAAYCVKKLGLSWDKVNVNGGAIAFGHPLGCTGTRMAVTLIKEMRRRGKNQRGIVSMCIGSGMGAAGVFETE